MRKIIGVGAVLLLAGAVMAPANAAPVATDVRAGVVSTVAVVAPADAALSFESPVVGTVAAPVAEVVPVTAEAPVVAPVAPVQAPAVEVAPVAAEAPTVRTAEAGGTVEEQETETPVEVVPPVVEPEPVPTEPEPVIVPEPEPTTPEVVEVQEGDAYAYSEWDPAFYEYNIDPATGQPFAGEYVGTVYAKSLAYFAGRTDVVVKEQPGVTFHPDMNPMGTNVLYVYHLWTAVE